MNLDSLKKKISDLASNAKTEFGSANDKLELDNIYRSYLGKKGEVNILLKSLGLLPQEKRKEAGKLLNNFKGDLEKNYALTSSLLNDKANLARLEKDKLDISLPGFSSRKGSIHPVTRTIRDVCDFFEQMGFDVEAGPEAEIDYYNFEALNVPEDHHRIICPGKVYRKDSDLTHTPMFHQIEGLVVEEGAAFAQLKGLLNDFLTDFFGEEVELRFRPSYFPFTEPSAEVDIRWKKNWLEVLGCGMVHPNVLKSVGVDTKKYSGFAFGLGVERMAMLKYDIPDLRAFFENDIRFLNQF